MSTIENLARVIIRPNGDVHIAFQDVRSVYATPNNLSELFSDPINFIYTQSYTYKESTFEINRNRVALKDVLGLTLATVNSDKQIVCDFPELFQYVFKAENNEKDKPLNMGSFEFELVLSDEKSYLLRYYLEFTNHLTSMLTIKNNIKLRNEVQSEIIREALNTFFMESLPEPSKNEDLSSQIASVENAVVFSGESNEQQYVGATEYSQIIGKSIQTVRSFAARGLINSAYKDNNGKWLFDRNDRPIDWDLRKGRKREPSPEGKHYKRRSSGSAEDVKQHILKLKLFSEKIAPYIHTYEELDYYTKRSYHEVCWDGQYALIIDINPDYISNEGVRNRDLIAEGKAPRVPDRNKDEYEFHIHHIGQHSTSPFAIIPKYDHQGFFKIFHPGSPNNDLHGIEFENQKIQFWKNYLKEYDKAGNFNLIEYSNPKAKRNKK